MTNELQIINHITRQIHETETVLRTKTKDLQGKDYEKRWLYYQIERYLKNHLLKKREQPRWIVVPGLKGIGKSTMLAQLGMFLLKKKNLHLIYFSLDEVVNSFKSNLREALHVYEDVSGVNLATTNKPTFIFLDEVHYDPTWSSQAKILFDKNPNVFIFATGSSAISLQQNADEQRRMIIERMFPMTLPEYMEIKRGLKLPKMLENEIKDIVFYSREAKKIYGRLKFLEKSITKYWSKIKREDLIHYLKVGSIPFANNFRDIQKAYNAIYRTLRAVIEKDFSQIKSFKSETQRVALHVLSLLSTSNSVSLRSLANITKSDARTISSILEAFQAAEILIRVPPRGGLRKKINKPSKYHFVTPALRAAVLNLVGGTYLVNEKRGYLFEDMIAMHLHRNFISSGAASVSHAEGSNEAGVDFIVEFLDKKIPIEVGLGKKDTKQLWSSIEACKSPYGLLVSSRKLELIQEKIICIPHRWFLLM